MPIQSYSMLALASLSCALIACEPTSSPPSDNPSTPTTPAASNNITTPAVNNTSPANNQTTPSANNTTPAANNTSPMPATCDRPDPTPLRRLSHFEYWNTVRALYPGVNFPAIELPADNRPHEFDNDADALTVNNALVERYLEVAAVIVETLRQEGRLAPLVPCAMDAPSDRDAILACGESFVRGEGERLFRRPLSDEEVERYSALFRDEELSDATFEQLQGFTLRLMMSAPEFLYRFEFAVDSVQPGEVGALDPWALASRLSYFIWGSMPDEALLAAARDGSLLTPSVLEAHATRMLDDERARGVFLHFHEQWLDLERLDVVVKKDEENFDDDMRHAMHEQGMMFIEHVLYDDRGTVNDLFTSPRTFINAKLAPLYGEEAPAGEMGWGEIRPEDRAGWLTQPAFLAGHGHPDKPSPVLRGTFVLERVLCSGVGAPPPNAEAMGAAKEEEIMGPMTNREIYDLTTNSEQPCTSCHVRINPPGYALESFDTMGRWRDVEPNGLPIDTSGTLDDFVFEDAVDLSAQLGSAERVEACVTSKWLRYAWSGGPLESSACLIEDVLSEARATGSESPDIRALQLAIVTHPWFALYRAPEPSQDEE